MIPRSPLDDPSISDHAWRRFRRQLRIAGWITLPVELLVLGSLFAIYGPISIHLYIGMALAIAMAAFLIAALTGLAFLSHGTGHDSAVAGQENLSRRD